MEENKLASQSTSKEESQDNEADKHCSTIVEAVGNLQQLVKQKDIQLQENATVLAENQSSIESLKQELQSKNEEIFKEKEKYEKLQKQVEEQADNHQSEKDFLVKSLNLKDNQLTKCKAENQELNKNVIKAEANCKKAKELYTYHEYRAKHLQTDNSDLKKKLEDEQKLRQAADAKLAEAMQIVQYITRDSIAKVEAMGGSCLEQLSLANPTLGNTLQDCKQSYKNLLDTHKQHVENSFGIINGLSEFQQSVGLTKNVITVTTEPETATSTAMQNENMETEHHDLMTGEGNSGNDSGLSDNSGNMNESGIQSDFETSSVLERNSEERSQQEAIANTISDNDVNNIQSGNNNQNANSSDSSVPSSSPPASGSNSIDGRCQASNKCGKQKKTKFRHGWIGTSSSNPGCFCCKCGREYKTQQELDTHISQEKQLHVCGFCKKRFGNRYDLMRHKKSHRNRDSPRKSSSSETSPAGNLKKDAKLNLQKAVVVLQRVPQSIVRRSTACSPLRPTNQDGFQVASPRREDTMILSTYSPYKIQELHHPDHGLDTSKIGVFCICGLHVNSVTTLKMHIQFFGDGLRFRCDVESCGKTNLNGINKNNSHCKLMHPEVWKNRLEQSDRTGCKKCGIIFNTKLELKQHRVKSRSKANQVQFMCPMSVIIKAKEPNVATTCGQAF